MLSGNRRSRLYNTVVQGFLGQTLACIPIHRYSDYNHNKDDRIIKSFCSQDIQHFTPFSTHDAICCRQTDYPVPRYPVLLVCWNAWVPLPGTTHCLHRHQPQPLSGRPPFCYFALTYFQHHYIRDGAFIPIRYRTPHSASTSFLPKITKERNSNASQRCRRSSAWRRGPEKYDSPFIAVLSLINQ